MNQLEGEEMIEDESEIEDGSEIEGDANDGDDSMDEEERNRAQAFSVKNQLIVWDMLINSRIRLQKALINCNKLPQPDQFQHFMGIGGEEVKEAQLRALKEETKLMESLSKLNDAITSREGEKEGADQVTVVDAAFGDEQLASNHTKLLSNVDRVISEWWQKTNYATRPTKSNAKSVEEDQTNIIENINSILSNRERLVKKTRTKRSQYHIIGKNDSIGEDEEETHTTDNDQKDSKKNHEETIDNEIYDDDDFYGQLLRQLIESKTSLDSVDPITLSRQWLEVQKLRRKMKRRIDTRASKGRRLRYQVHQPLISFMAPIEDCPYDDNAKDALFSSLFNQRKFEIQSS